jgi:protein NrfD
MTEIELTRNNAMVDPSLAIWGWEIPVYLFLGGVAAGLMIVSALMAGRFERSERSRAARLAPLLAPVVLSAGMLALLLDLENPLRVHRFYAVMRPSSAMSWGAWILIAIYPISLAFGLSGLTHSELERLGGFRLGRRIAEAASWAQSRQVWLRRATLALGIALGGYTGILLASMGARPVWGTMLLGPLFLVSGLSTGAAVVMLLPIGHREHALVRRWDMWAIGVELGLLLLFLLGLSTGGAETREAAGLFLGGSFTTPFWSGVVAVGLLTPLALEASETLRRLKPNLIAPVLILIGGLMLRWVLVAAGQA